MPDKDKKTKLPEPETTPDGIKIAVSGDEWILFPRDGWSLADELQMMKSNDFDAFKLIVERAKDWRLIDIHQAVVPFDQKGLLNTLQLMDDGRMSEAREATPLPKLPPQNRSAIVRAYYTAINEAGRLPLANNAKSTD